MLTSCHSHSGEFCKHATGTLQESIEKAVELGFTSYCLTEHMPRYSLSHLYPEEQGLQPLDLENQYDRFHKRAIELKLLYKDKINLIIGLETEWITDDYADKIDALIKKYRLLFTVGSVHHLRQIPIDFDLPTFKTLLDTFSVEEMFEMYYDQQFQMLSKLHPTVVGHFDLIRLYKDVWTESIANRIKRNLEYVKSYGGIIEFNSRAFQKTISSQHMLRVSLMIKRMGNRITLSDDSHGFTSVGACYYELIEYLIALGFTSYYVPLESGGNLEWKECSMDSQMLEKVSVFPRIDPGKNWNVRLKEIEAHLVDTESSIATYI